mmetsp:Transcript_22840/g.58172  ORF Transcript_22840/g.58172 Transcript_22840/m.58172 type:complete len:232 (-) Transcript_22840:189-884(-)
MGRGMPPGPPRDSAVMKRWNSALWRAVATSSAQYLNSTGRSRSARTATCSMLSTSGASESLMLRHSACTHLHRRSYAVSWCVAMTSMSSRPARWWCVRSRDLQLSWICLTRASAAKNLGFTSSPCSAAVSSGVSWYCSKKLATSCDLRSAASYSCCRRSISPSSWDVEVLVVARMLLIWPQLDDKPSRLPCTWSRTLITASAAVMNFSFISRLRCSIVERKARREAGVLSL